MSGNEFLKHPPHRNTGNIPYPEYNALRFQMEAAKLPFMRKVFSNGILEVRKIFENQYKVNWTPLGGVEVCYVSRYKDKNGIRRIKFLDKWLHEVIDVEQTVFPSTVDTGCPETLLLSSWECSVNGLICCWIVENGPPISSTLGFYSPFTGRMVPNGLDPPVTGFYLNSATPVAFTPVVPMYTVQAIGDKVYITENWNGADIVRITVGVDPVTEEYTFTKNTFSTDVPSSSYFFWDGDIFYGLDLTYSGLFIMDKDSGNVSSLLANDPGMRRLTPHGYYDNNIAYFPGGSAGPIPPATLKVSQTAIGECYYTPNLSIFPGYWTIYDSTGNNLGNSPGFSVVEKMYWTGFGGLDLHWLEITATSSRIVWGVEVKTIEDMYALFHMPEDITEWTTLNYLPGLENDVRIAAILP